MAKQMKYILVVAAHNAFREALAIRLSQEEDLEVTWQAGSIAETRNVHLDGIDVTLVDPLLPDGDGLVLIREMSVANPSALGLVLCPKLEPGMHHQAVGAGAVEVISTNTSMEEVINTVRRAASAE
jgi:DNA-binding NarL/FixJ family response regulator